MSIHWKCCEKDTTQRKVLENVLPQQYSYKVLSYQLIESSDLLSESKFFATIQINICNEKDRDGNRIFRTKRDDYVLRALKYFLALFFVK